MKPRAIWSMITRMTRLLSLLVVLAACAPPPIDTAQIDGGGTPSIEIIFPDSDDDKVYCSTFMIAVQIDDFEVVPADKDAPITEGIGHWHLLDEGQKYLIAITDQFYFLEAPLEDGRRGLYAELVAENHQSYEPRILNFAEFTVDNEAVDDPATEDVYEGCWGGSTAGGTSGGY